MKASALALALSCLLSQFTSVAACDVERRVSETNRAGVTMAPGAGSTVNFADTRRSRTLSNEACELLYAAQYEQAEAKLRAAISMEPGLASAHCNLGLLLNKTGRPQEAIKHLEYAHAQAPNEAAPLVTLAASHQLSGNLSQAISLYNEYMERFSSAPDRAVIADIVKHLQAETARVARNAGAPAGFHWSKNELKVYVHTASGVTGFRDGFNDILRESFASWSESGPLKFEFVSELSQADVECIWTDDSTKLSSLGEGGEAVLRHRGSVVTHARITLLTNRPNANHAKLSEREVKTLCLHEIGHALGMMEHSVRPDDVMYCTLTSAAVPSPHDFSLLSDLYKAN